ncbi:N-acetylmuramoyl-L-alanine amidase, partial [Hydrogenibacillus schlegelii]|uniref:N-acetylmuramoyl-L-alanine amidase n=1 Tax=Hydrogenibacillus schlegelii TaxID=1484 RepID=UPI00349FDEE1
TEKASALDLAQKIRSALLDRYDVRVELTRTEDVTVPLANRAAFANRLRADFFFSVLITPSTAGPGV